MSLYDLGAFSKRITIEQEVDKQKIPIFDYTISVSTDGRIRLSGRYMEETRIGFREIPSHIEGPAEAFIILLTYAIKLYYTMLKIKEYSESPLLEDEVFNMLEKVKIIDYVLNRDV